MKIITVCFFWGIILNYTENYDGQSFIKLQYRFLKMKVLKN